MRKANLAVFSLVLALNLVVCARIFLCSAAEPYQATVEDISGDRYFPAVKEALSNAKKSINLVMYLVNFDPKSKTSPVSRLVEELLSAHKRGVKVKVILDQNISFSEWEDRGGKWEREEKNDPLFVYLKKQGIEVYYDNLFVVTHSKFIVIDEELVILGSANWTVSSLKRNWEASCLIRSKGLAEKFLEDFNKITIDYEASILDAERKPPVRLAEAFLKIPSLAPRMVKYNDEGAFNLYLLLLRRFDGNAETKVEVDYELFSRELGYDVRLSYVSARDNIMRSLMNLEKKYKLIRRIQRPPKGPYAVLLDYTEKTPYTLPEGKYCSMPDEYWKYGWNKRLSLPESFCYLICLCKAGAVKKHVWRDHIIGLSKDFNVSRDTIGRGMQALRQLNIIEIEYAPYLPEEDFRRRGPSLFKLLRLYSPEILDKEKMRLKDLYGNKLFEEAEQYAKIVFKGNDIQVIEDIIKKRDEYGSGTVDDAFRVVSKKSAANPKRSYKYVVGVIQTKAREAEKID